LNNIGVTDLKSLIDSDESFVLLDVREPMEIATAAIEPHHHIPMGIIPLRLNELERDQHLVVICHHGNRSYQVCLFLERNGFSNISNVVGGIDAWSKQIDPSVPVY
jgi:rhodanese-related sulfurtransferase